MKGNIQKFGKKLIENVKIYQTLISDHDQNQNHIENQKKYY